MEVQRERMGRKADTQKHLPKVVCRNKMPAHTQPPTQLGAANQILSDQDWEAKEPKVIREQRINTWKSDRQTLWKRPLPRGGWG